MHIRKFLIFAKSGHYIQYYSLVSNRSSSLAVLLTVIGSFSFIVIRRCFLLVDPPPTGWEVIVTSSPLSSWPAMGHTKMLTSLIFHETSPFLLVWLTLLLFNRTPVKNAPFSICINVGAFYDSAKSDNSKLKR